MTLVALFAMTTGAWADEATITLKCGTTEKTYENVTLPWSSTGDILKQVISDYKNVASNIDAITGGDGKVVKYGNEQFTVTGTFSGEATVVVSWYNSTKQSATITVTAPGPLLTLNEAKTEATMESMPTSDVTIDYELVRDMSVQMTATMGDGTDGLRYRVKKAQQGEGYEPADMNMMQVLALVAVNDGIEHKALTLNQDYFCRIYKLDEQTLLPEGDGVKLFDFDFAPGLYALKAFATDGSNYDGETALSNTFKLFEGYEVVVPAGEYATFYKDEALYVEDEDGELYTITSVSGDKAILSNAIETAPSGTPLLVYNKGTEEKTFLLIPANAEPNLALDVYDGFIGTMQPTVIAASDASTDNYAFNGKQFVWVMNEIAIGANKAYLSIPKTNGNPKNIRLYRGNGETTGIDASLVNSEEVNSVWYDLNGRRLQGKPSQKGIYIKNGKKVVVH